MIRRATALLIAFGLALIGLPAVAATPQFGLHLAGVSPTWLADNSAVQLKLTSVSNGDRQANLRVRLTQKSLFGRSQIAAALANQLDTAMTAPIASAVVDLADGSNRLAIEVPANALASLADGVYAIQVDLSEGSRSRRVQTLLPILRGTVPNRLQVVTLLRLAIQPTLVGDQRYSSASSVNQFSSTGSVMGVMAGSEGVAGLTWLLDPDLVVSAQAVATGGKAMSDAGYEVSNETAGTARDILDKLPALTAKSPVYLTQFAAADLNGLVVNRRPALARASLHQDAAARTLLERADVATAVVAARGDLSDLAWTWLDGQSAPLVVLDASRWPAKTASVTPSGVITTPAKRRALVIDSQLSSELAAGFRNAASAVSARQAWAADLLLTALEAPGTQRTVVASVATNGSRLNARAVAATLANLRLPWVDAIDATTALQSTPSKSRVRKSGNLRATFSTSDLRLISQLDRRRTTLTEIIGDSVHNTRLLQNELRITSATFTADAQRQLYSTQAVAEQQSIEHAVRIVSSGSVMLPGDAAKVPITIRNDLEVPVTVSVATAGVPAVRVQADPISAVTIAAGKRKSIEIPTRVTGSGSAQLQLQLQTVSGKRIGNPVLIQLASSAYSKVAGWVVGFAFALLLLLVLLNVWRRIRRTAGSRDGN